MKTYYRVLFSILLCLSLISAAYPQSIRVGDALKKAREASCLTCGDGSPFHLKATVQPVSKFIPEYTAEIEEYWVSPTKWRREIHSPGFEQTIVVNDGKRYEHASSDYYPKWLDDIVVALFEVAPEYATNRVGKLQNTVQTGQAANVRYQPSSTDGTVVNSWGGGVEFDAKGRLTWISGELFSARFADYKTFHGKQVAQRVETFPLVPHGDVLASVQINSFDGTDENRFAVDRPTARDEQVRLVYMDEVEYRKLATNHPEMKWAPLTRRPTSGTLSLHIITDKTGKVREVNFLTSNNMDMRSSAESLVRQWQFKPFLVDGIPAEVSTTMTFAYEAKLLGDQAKYEAASSYFKLGRNLTYPRTDDSAAFHLIGSFEWRESNTVKKGQYEEFWYAPDRWRREFTINGKTLVETRIHDNHYRAPGIQSSSLIVSVSSLFTEEFPGYAYYSPDWDWHMDEITLLDAPCLRVSMGPLDNIPAGHYPRAYYFDASGRVQGRSQGQELISYANFQPWNNKQVPRQIVRRLGNAVVMLAHIEMIEPAAAKEDRFFVLKGIAPQGR